jgi:putative adhesin
MRKLMTVIAAAGAFALTGSHLTAQSDFRWSGQIPAGQTLEIKGVNGDIQASEASGNSVEVTATRSARRSNAADVRIVVVPSSTGVTICAVYPDIPGRRPNECAPGSGGHAETKDNDTVVNFEVRLPYGVGFIGRTVNGEVVGRQLQGTAEGHTVNGSVNLETSGVAVATTVNGGITASMGRADWAGRAVFKTVNGSINLTMPGVLSADLHATTLNGSITTDFPVAATGRISPQRLEGRIGNGGYDLDLNTVNGSIRLTRGQ